MNTKTPRTAAVLATACAALMVAACGGGEEAQPLERTAVAAATAAADKLALRGCVVDEYFIPRTGRAVRLLGADGRLLGHAFSDRDGAFTFQAPVQQRVTLNVDKAGGEALVVNTAEGAQAARMCLIDPQA